RPAATRRAAPAKEDAEHLPQGVEAEAARHHRIALEMALEEPEVGIEVELRPDQALAVAATGVTDMGDAVEHQDWRGRQLRPGGPEQLAFSRSDVIVVSIRVAAIRHSQGPVPDGIRPVSRGGRRGGQYEFRAEAPAHHRHRRPRPGPRSLSEQVVE